MRKGSIIIGVLLCVSFVFAQGTLSGRCPSGYHNKNLIRTMVDTTCWSGTTTLDTTYYKRWTELVWPCMMNGRYFNGMVIAEMYSATWPYAKLNCVFDPVGSSQVTKYSHDTVWSSFDTTRSYVINFMLAPATQVVERQVVQFMAKPRSNQRYSLGGRKVRRMNASGCYIRGSEKEIKIIK